jgi:large subunit ribosomal protein L30
MTFVVIRVRGTVNINTEISDTLKMLRLNRVNHCIFMPNRKSYAGMLQKVKDYVTWGDAKPETLAKMIIRRGRLEGDKKVSDKYIKANTDYSSVMAFAKALLKDEVEYKDLKDIKPIIRLHPPRKGYEGLKRTYREGGALGYRGKDIDELIDRML